MFNNPKIHLYNKLACLFLSLLVIVFNTSSISLLLMFIIYFMFVKNDKKIYSLIISLFFVLAYAFLYVYDVTIWVKLILIIAYAYYYLYLDLAKIKFKKKTTITEVKKEIVSEEVKEKVNEELKNGDSLTEEEKEQIENNLDKKIDEEVKEKQDNYFLRYYQVQRKLIRRKYNLNMDNILYVFVNVLAMVICILVEKIWDI